MYSDVFVQFVSANWDLVGKWELYETLSAFFILVNLHLEYFSFLEECLVVDQNTFLTFFGNSENANHVESSGSDSDKLQNISILLAKDNVALTVKQKRVISELICQEKRDSINLPPLQIFVCRNDNKYSIIICECCILTTIKLLDFVPRSTLLRSDGTLTFVSKYENVELTEEYINISNNAILSGLDEKVYICIEDLSITALFFLLYINPYLSEISTTLQLLITTTNRRNLLKCTLFVNNLLKSYPKEVDLWDIKSCVALRWFTKYNYRLKLCKISNGFAKIFKCSKSQLFHIFLKSAVFRFLSDELLELESKFIPEILSIKPFNNPLSNYLENLYRSICTSVCVKCTYNFVVNHNRRFPESNNSVKNLNLVNTRTKYRICLLKVVNSYFIRWYYNLVREYPFPSLFLLLLDILNSERLCNTALTPIYPEHTLSNNMESYMNENIIDLLRFCDDMIPYDVQNCWIYNKSNALLTIFKRSKTHKSMGINEKAYMIENICKFSFVFTHHLSTWTSFVSICEIISYQGNLLPKKGLIRRNSRRFSKLERSKDSCDLRDINYWKSEAAFIKNAIEKYKLSGKMKKNTELSYGEDINNYIWCRKSKYNKIFYAKLMLKHFTIAQIDRILQAYRQLFLILSAVYRELVVVYNIYNLSLLSPLEPLTKTLLTLYKYVKLTSSTKNPRSIVNLLEKMEKSKRTLGYKCFTLTTPTKYGLDVIYCDIDWKDLATISMILLSSPCRFYLEWDISSHSMLDVIYQQLLKLVKR
ncbi:hypothetical protein BEWA_034500 [Theileria equi strain WA]|uniref:Uncharacterized protein n=1 Tax=Theileria equi strain WA TaxID=1537102 RepID=L0AYC5_THEEQ|nr:hypothetical protein BEWA_034500 [Theileria equi strain WA]AFZ80592.1 hypothetical protein BEWA_034500 [Theileria equi strain WA]|eukprot:XP_004830258.1 hypothetical protein BEWA_034500 [Theileria equi strain WA]